MFRLDAVSISRIVKLRAIAVVIGEAIGLCSRPIGIDRQIIKEGEVAVDAIRFVRTRTKLRFRPAREKRADTAFSENVSFDPED